MSARFKRLNPLRARLKKMLQKGWERAVFREPLADGDAKTPTEEVKEGPGRDQAPEPRHIEELWDDMHAAAQRGLVKQVIVIDATHRLEIDARHGSLRQKRRDPESIKKMMGQKDRLFRPDRSQALLRELSLLNADGTMSRRHARKYKQVHHFVELCQPVVAKILATKKEGEPLKILDLACGNSYLGFVLLEAMHLQQTPAQLLGVDANPQWVHASQDRARNLPHLNAEFHCGLIETIRDSDQPAAQAPDLVVALHACDTATDSCIAMALAKEVPAFLCAPCCHAQVARQLSERSVMPGLQALQEHGHLRRAYGELVTDALRVAWIAAHGYEVSVVEFVELEHSSKNLLIRALKKGPRSEEKIHELRTQCEAMGIQPALIFPKDPPK